EENDPDY
nr:Chain C, ASN-ASP-PRO-ASP-TYR [Homo sapiens]